MYVLDTDHMSLLERVDSIDKQRLLNRLGRLPEGDVATSIIAFEEQIRGWTAYLSKSKSMSQHVDAYRRLRLQLNNYCSILVLDFDDRSATVFQDLKTQRLKVGTMDLKMASIVLANNATLLSRNLRDFRRVPNLRVEDWVS
jgi:tRNA(fMet)-specific endonuclease VapC